MAGLALPVLEPATLDEALAALADESTSAKVIAGGTRVTLLMRQRLLSADRLVALHRLPLASLAEQDGMVSIGALATHAEIAASGLVNGHYPALASAFARVASPRIRNMGTIGGNLVHGEPHLDPPVALLAAGATVTVRSLGAEREIALDNFFIGFSETALLPTEILTSVRIPPRSPGEGLSFIKHLARSRHDQATVDISVWLAISRDGRIEDARIAIGGAGPTVFRAREAEALVRGTPVDRQATSAAGDAAASLTEPQGDTRGAAEYKRQLIRVLVPRAVDLALEDAARPSGGSNAPVPESSFHDRAFA